VGDICEWEIVAVTDMIATGRPLHFQNWEFFGCASSVEKVPEPMVIIAHEDES
jgi:hypothetical protein